MAGKDNCTTAGQCSTTDSRSSRHSGSTQQKKRAQQYRVALLTGLPGQNYVPECQVSGRNFLQAQTLSRLHRAKFGGIFSEEGFMAGTGGAGGRTEGKKPLFFTHYGWLGRHQSGKQPVKDGGVCRVIWTSTQAQQTEKAAYFVQRKPNSAAFPYAHIGRNRISAFSFVR